MDFSDRGNRPQQQPAAQPATQREFGTTNQGGGFGSMGKKGSGRSKMDASKLASVFVLFGVSLLVVVLIFGLVFGGGDDTTSNNTLTSEAALISPDQYQAIFLNSQDGQVYFGKLGIVNSHLYKLEDIYYVRVENPIQPEGANQPQQPNISLAKLGNELHGPEDTMYIARDVLLYWENLKDEGQVVTAIKNFKENGEQTQNTQQNTQQGTDANANQPASGAQQPAETTNPTTP